MNNIPVGIVAGIWPCGIITFLGENLVLNQNVRFIECYMLFLMSTKSQLVTSVSVSKNDYLRKLYTFHDIGYLHVHAHVTQKYGLMKLLYLHFYVSCRAHLLQCCLSFKKYATHKERKRLTATAGRITSMTIVVDKLHFRGHTDKWCQEFCNPYKFDELNEVRFVEHVHLILCTDKIHSLIQCRLIPKYVNRHFLGSQDTRASHRE